METLRTRTAPVPTAIEGLTFLLASSPHFGESVARYTAAEMDELFSEAELEQLRSGIAVTRGTGRYGTQTWRDMVAATRLAA